MWGLLSPQPDSFHQEMSCLIRGTRKAWRPQRLRMEKEKEKRRGVAAEGSWHLGGGLLGAGLEAGL